MFFSIGACCASTPSYSLRSSMLSRASSLRPSFSRVSIDLHLRGGGAVAGGDALEDLERRGGAPDEGQEAEHPAHEARLAQLVRVDLQQGHAQVHQVPGNVRARALARHHVADPAAQQGQLGAGLALLLGAQAGHGVDQPQLLAAAGLLEVRGDGPRLLLQRGGLFGRPASRAARVRPVSTLAPSSITSGTVLDVFARRAHFSPLR